MNVDIEFFDENPMDNVLSCMKFCFSKVIFLGYAEEDMDRAAKSTVTAFLKSKKIGVKEIEFVPLPEGDLDAIENKLTHIVECEKAVGNQCYFDLTGGEELVLAAAGIVADKHSIPMHEIDLSDDAVRIQAMPELYENLPKRDYRLTIEEYLNLHEGVIEWQMQKKNNINLDQTDNIERLNELVKFTTNMGKTWNRLSSGLANFFSGQGVIAYRNDDEIGTAAKLAGMSSKQFMEHLRRMYKMNFLKKLEYENGIATVMFYNLHERRLLCNAGAILEHNVYWKIREDPDVNDCVIGYHINWIGEGDPMSIYEPGPNVLNEIDVIYMRKNIPTFVSCKNKLVDSNQPLYELETVADRFGGKLVRKVLVAKGGTSPGIALRAKEMGIFIRSSL